MNCSLNFVLLLVDGSLCIKLPLLLEFYSFFKGKFPCHVALSFCLFPWSAPTSLIGSPYTLSMALLFLSAYICSLCLFTDLSPQDITNFQRAGIFCIIVPYQGRLGHFLSWDNSESLLQTAYSSSSHCTLQFPHSLYIIVFPSQEPSPSCLPVQFLLILHVSVQASPPRGRPPWEGESSLAPSHPAVSHANTHHHPDHFLYK